VALLERSAIPPFALLLLIAGTLAARRRSPSAVLATGSRAFSVLILIAAHISLGMFYPWTRTGLYLIWLFLAACVALWQWTAKEPGQIRVLAAPLGVACVSLAALFLTEFETRYYSDFPY